MTFIGFIGVGVCAVDVAWWFGWVVGWVLFYCTFDVCFGIMCLLRLFWLNLLRCCGAVWMFDDCRLLVWFVDGSCCLICWFELFAVCLLVLLCLGGLCLVLVFVIARFW